MADDFHSGQFVPNTRCSPFDCACGSASMAIAFGGGPRFTHDQIRAQSGVSCVPGVDTLSGGLRIADVERVAASHGIVIDYGRKPDGTYTSWPRDALRQRLVAGHGAILLGDCQDAPVNPTTGVVLHSAFVHGLDANGRTHWHDPRLPQPYWITLADVIRYWESFNGSVRYAGFVAPDQAGPPPDTGTGGDDMSRPFDITSDQQGWIRTDLAGKSPTFIDPFTGVRTPLPLGISKRVFGLTSWRDTGIGGFLIGKGAAIVEDDGQQSWEPDPVDPPTDPGTKLARGRYFVE